MTLRCFAEDETTTFFTSGEIELIEAQARITVLYLVPVDYQVLASTSFSMR